MADKKPVVLYVIDTLQIGGAEKSLLEIAKRLKDFTPVVCTIYSRNSDLRSLFLDHGVHVRELNVTSYFWWLAGASKLNKIVRELRPAIVHATLFKAEIITRLLLGKGKIPHIGSFVNDSYAIERYKKLAAIQIIKLEFYRLVDRLTSMQTKHFTAITNAIAISNSKALSVNFEKIKVIYRGRDPQTFLMKHPPYGGGESFIFITVARLLKRKGYGELLLALEILMKKGYQFRQWIVGDGHDRSFIENEILRLGLQDHVIVLGKKDNVPVLLSDAHCFVFPSHYEGQGGALVEAMFSGKPIVATRIPVIEEQIDDERDGLLFNPFDAADMAAKMEWMIINYEKGVSMGKSAREAAEKRFNINEIVAQYEDYYGSLLGSE